VNARAPAHERDIAPTPFTPILTDLVARLPGGLAAVLVDQEGETVDYAGDCEPYEIKVLGAHWRIVVDLVTESTGPRSGALRLIAVRGRQKSVLVRPLPERYAVVVLLRRRAGFAPCERAFSSCEQALAAEAGWAAARTAPTLQARAGARGAGGRASSTVPPRPPPTTPPGAAARSAWFGVTMTCDERRRPVRIEYGGLEEPVEVLGTLSGKANALGRRERGFRIRLASGPEITVVRDASGHWYAEESGVG
jgi:hypothetical protein